MRDCRHPIFLTLVVSALLVLVPTFIWAAPNDEMKPQILKEPIQNISDPALTDYEKSAKNNKNIVQLNFGAIAGQVTKKIDSGTSAVYGLTYDWRDFDLNYWSLSAKWLSRKAAWVEIGKIFPILPENLYEPYYKLSVSHFMDPDDALAGITRIDAYKGSAAFGVLDLWTLGRIVNFEIGSHWGLAGLAFSVQAGAQWSF